MKNDAAFYEREYNARAAIPEHPQIFAGWAERGAITRRLRACLIDLPYGDTPPERLDLFPTRQDAAPLLVYIHGGYWRSLDKSDFSWLAPPYVQHGISVALLNYGLAPATPIEDMVRQQLKALAWLYRNGDRLGFDPERIVVTGHSAGAHLTAMMMAAQWPAYASDLPPTLVKAGLAISGIYDVAPLVEAPFINVDLRLDRARARRLSPALMPPATAAPLITAVGALESSEFHRQTALLARTWKGVVRRSMNLAGAHHLGVVEELASPASVLFDAALELVRASKR
ncbi:MAG TPA: alpha/beta hydrolase [Burkholderiaceae bacterium]|nr:alpha/beta hydrolase [Burkholderiaceae bacterium]